MITSISEWKKHIQNSINETWKAKVQDNYETLEELQEYDEIYGIAKRLGYNSAEELWNANPVISGSTDPKDLKVIKEATVSKKNIDKLLNLAKSEDKEEFINEFDNIYNTAAEMWLDAGKQRKLMTMYLSNKYIFTGSNSEKTCKKMKEKGWKLFAEEHNYDSYDAILYKNKIIKENIDGIDNLSHGQIYKVYDMQSNGKLLYSQLEFVSETPDKYIFKNLNGNGKIEIFKDLLSNYMISKTQKIKKTNEDINRTSNKNAVRIFIQMKLEDVYWADVPVYEYYFNDRNECIKWAQTTSNIFQKQVRLSFPDPNWNDIESDLSISQYAEQLSGTYINPEVKESKVNEEIITNSDKETKLDGYQLKLQNYNANKSKFNNILAQPTDNQENLAKDVIDGNEYLNFEWRIAKLDKQIKDDQIKVNQGQLSNDEKNELNAKINTNKQELNKIQTELKSKIADDLKNIQAE